MVTKRSRADGLQASILQALTGSSMDEDTLPWNDLDKLESFTIDRKPESVSVDAVSDAQTALDDSQTVMPRDEEKDVNLNLSSDSGVLKKLLRPLQVSLEENNTSSKHTVILLCSF